MTYTPELRAELDAAVYETSASPMDPAQIGEALRWYRKIGGNNNTTHLRTQSGIAAARVFNAYPGLTAHIDAQAAEIARLREALGDVKGLVIEAIDLERIGAIVALDAISDIVSAALAGDTIVGAKQ